MVNQEEIYSKRQAKIIVVRVGLKVTIGVHVGNTINDKLDDVFSQNTIAEFFL